MRLVHWTVRFSISHWDGDSQFHINTKSKEWVQNAVSIHTIRLWMVQFSLTRWYGDFKLAVAIDLVLNRAAEWLHDNFLPIFTNFKNLIKKSIGSI